MNRPSRRAALGKAGERHARLWLEARGYHFVAANWHCEAGELDLVMLDGEQLAFVEVKTRTGERSGRASEAVTSIKGQRVLESAEWFLAAHPEHEERTWRCDILAVTLSATSTVVSVQHLVNAIFDE